MSAAVDNELLRAAVERLATRSLAPIREAALENFCGAGLPTTRHEDWRYTNLAPVAELSNRWLSDRSHEPEFVTPDIDRLDAIRTEIDAYWIELPNGRIDPESLAQIAGQLGGGVTVTRMSDAAPVPGLHIDDALSSLNAALMDDALLLRIDDRVSLDKPIGFLLSDVAASSSPLSQSRIVIQLGRDSTVEFIEAHRSEGDDDHFANLVTEVMLDAGAVARYVKIQERSEDHMQVGRLIVRLDRDSRFEHASVDLGGKLIRNDVIATIAGAGAWVSTSGIYLSDGRQHIDNHVLVDHAVGPSTSRQTYRGIASGQSRCVFNGKAVVREGADGTDAEQSNHNLLLSDRAEIDTKPELEIYADDVKCSHGATVGQLDKRAIFYLRSRGLDRDQAAQILTRAFAGRIVSEIPIESARHYIEHIVDQKLDALVEDDAA